MKPDWYKGGEKKPQVRLLNPHGSDETFIITISTTSPYHLLNPHGSDETKGGKDYDRSYRLFFLTHTVQMKQ